MDFELLDYSSSNFTGSSASTNSTLDSTQTSDSFLIFPDNEDEMHHLLLLNSKTDKKVNENTQDDQSNEEKQLEEPCDEDTRLQVDATENEQSTQEFIPVQHEDVQEENLQEAILDQPVNPDNQAYSSKPSPLYKPDLKEIQPAVSTNFHKITKILLITVIIILSITELVAFYFGSHLALGIFRYDQQSAPTEIATFHNVQLIPIKTEPISAVPPQYFEPDHQHLRDVILQFIKSLLKYFKDCIEKGQNLLLKEIRIIEALLKDYMDHILGVTIPVVKSITDTIQSNAKFINTMNTNVQSKMKKASNTAFDFWAEMKRQTEPIFTTFSDSIKDPELYSKIKSKINSHIHDIGSKMNKTSAVLTEFWDKFRQRAARATRQMATVRW